MRQRHVHYLSDDDVRVVSDHDDACFNGVDSDLKIRFRNDAAFTAGVSDQAFVVEQPKAGGKPLENVTVRFDKPALLNEAKRRNKQCARDHKWGHAERCIKRQDCDCARQVGVMVAIYRLWKCTSSGIVENQGLGSVSDRNPRLEINELKAGRDYWFPRRANRTKQKCVFYTEVADSTKDIQTTIGTTKLYHEVLPMVHDFGPNNTHGLNLTHGGLWFDTKSMKDEGLSQRAWKVPAWPANDLTDGLTLALEFEHTQQRQDPLYEKQWGTADDYKAGEVDVKVQPPLVPLVYRTWPDYETLKEAATALYYQQKQEVRVS